MFRNFIQHCKTSNTLLFFLMSFPGCYCFGQTKQVAGYYINTSGDTLKGVFSKYKNWELNPHEVEFIESRDGAKTSLTPDNCKAFHIENYDDYIGFIGKRLTNPVEFIEAVKDLDSTDHYSGIKTFLRVIYENPTYSLLEFKDKQRPNYFIMYNNGPIVELLYKQYNDMSGSVQGSFTYRSQLQSLVAGRTNLQNSLERLEYKQKELISFFLQVGGDTQKQSIKKIRNQFYLSTGGTITFFNNPYNNEKFSTSVFPFWGIGLIDYSQRNFGRTFFTVEAKVYYTKNVPTTSNPTTTFEAIIPGLYINTGYNLINQQKNSWYVSLGFGLLAPISKNKIYSGTQAGGFISKTDISLAAALIPKTGITLNKKIDVFAGYSFPITHFSTYNPGKPKSLQIGINYKLRK